MTPGMQLTPGVRRLAGLMQFLLVAAFLCALGGAFLPGSAGRMTGTVCVAVLIGAPILRVLWLTMSWTRAGDRRFALLGGILLAVLTLGSALAFLA